jgi:excisionase family DNA binding protein
VPRLKKKWMPPAVSSVPEVPTPTAIAPYLNVKDAARYLGVTKWAIYAHIQDGRLAAKTGLGQGFIVRTADLDRLWESAESVNAA